MHYKMNKTSALKVPLVSIFHFHFHYHLIWWDYIAWFYDGFNWSSLILCNAHMLDNYFLKSRCYCFHEKCLFNMAYSCNKINFDNRWSDAHFVSFLFYYYCKNVLKKKIKNGETLVLVSPTFKFLIFGLGPVLVGLLLAVASWTLSP